MDAGALTASVVQGALAPSVPAAPGGEATAPAAPDSVARFEAAMGGGQPDAGPNAPVDPTGAVGTAGPAEPGATEAPPAEIAPLDATASPGDVILRGLEHLRDDFDGVVKQVSNPVSSVQGGDMMNASDLMRMQFSLMQVTLEQDVASKVAGKATQNLDTFLKNQ